MKKLILSFIATGICANTFAAIGDTPYTLNQNNKNNGKSSLKDAYVEQNFNFVSNPNYGDQYDKPLYFSNVNLGLWIKGSEDNNNEDMPSGQYCENIKGDLKKVTCSYMVNISAVNADIYNHFAENFFSGVSYNTSMQALPYIGNLGSPKHGTLSSWLGVKINGETIKNTDIGIELSRDPGSHVFNAVYAVGSTSNLHNKKAIVTVKENNVPAIVFTNDSKNKCFAMIPEKNNSVGIYEIILNDTIITQDMKNACSSVMN